MTMIIQNKCIGLNNGRDDTSPCSSPPSQSDNILKLSLQDGHFRYIVT